MSFKTLILGSLFCLSGFATPAYADDLATLDSTHIEQHTRLLAASCAACHGTNGNSVGNNPALAGMDEDQFISQMLAFKNGSHASTVMHHHAKGLTADEINELAVYFSQQDRKVSMTPKPQTLKASHE